MKLSIVIPVHNTRDYLAVGLDSIRSQNFKDFEVICVDDASTDGSDALLREYAEKDERIRCIYYTEHVSAAMCRKAGVLASSGDYVMFMDADDYFEKGALKTAYQAVTDRDVDVLQFGTNIENCAGLPEKQIQGNEKALYPYTSEILRGDLLYACYAENRISVTIWNKIVRGTVCRQAFAQMEDGYFPKANDLYATFLIYYYASSFAGLRAKLYHYCFGRGMTGHRVFDMEQFTVHCQGAKVYDALRRFAQSLPEAEGRRVFDALRLLQKRLLKEQIGKWWNNLDPDYREAGLSLIGELWGGDEDFILSALADAFLYKRGEIADYVIRRYEAAYRPREIRTVMLYYRSLHGGGAQHVVAQLASLFAADGRFRVIVVTDEEPNEEEFELHEAVERVYIPHCDEIKNTGYLIRARKWKEILDQYPADVFLDSNWLSPVSLFDMICIKKHVSRPAFVFHSHSFFAMLYRLKADSVNEMYVTYAAADAVVALSEIDRQYWRHVNRRSYQIGNPIQYDEDRSSRAEYGRRILWLARLNRMKHPFDLIRIMRKVVQTVPDAVCDVVGGGDDALLEELQTGIEKAGLKDHILLHGMQTDTGMYYRQASVFLATSEYEGFPLTLYESASYGLPTVLYELPWLEYCHSFQGWSSVPQRDADAAAEQIVRLLTDDAYWKKQSDRIYESFEAYRRYDIKQEWEKVFSDLAADAAPDLPAPDSNEGIMLRQIARFHAIGRAEEKENYEKKSDDLTHKVRNTREKIERMENQKDVLKRKLQQTRDERSELKHRVEELEAQVRELSHPVKHAAKKVMGKDVKKD